MEKEASEERPRMRQKADKAKKYKNTRDDVYATEGFENKNRSKLVKIDNLFICKEGEND